MSAGDKTLSENYLQPADNFMRIIEDKNKNKNQIKNNSTFNSTEETKSVDSTHVEQKEEINKKV